MRVSGGRAGWRWCCGSGWSWIGSGNLGLPASRQGTRWLDVLKTLVCYQLIDPGSEWRLHRHWYEHSAMGDLLGRPARVVGGHTLYRCLDKLLAHKRAFFSFLRERWETLFDARFDVLLYDLTSTYFESDPTFTDKRRFGYSRDKRSDCVQVAIALIVTPQGFPLAYEVMAGNTSDKTTLADFLKKIEAQYGRSDRVWIMDRGIPTEETLKAMRTGQAPVHYLVGTPKGRFYRDKWNGRLPLPDVGDREDRGGPSEPTASKVPNGEAWASQAKRRVQ